MYIHKNTSGFWHENFVNFNYFLILVVIIRTKNSDFPTKILEVFIRLFANLREVNISFVMSAPLSVSVHPSVGPHEKLAFHWRDNRDFFCWGFY